MKLTVVGCCGSMSGPRAAASSYLVQAEDAGGRIWSVLLDLGFGSGGALMTYLDPRALDAIFFSHLHPDHMADVSSLQVYLRYHPEGETTGLPTWGPVETAQRIAAVCWIDDPAEVARQFDVHEYVEGEAVAVGPLRLEPIRVNHPVPAFGVRVTGPGREPGSTVTLAYTGDTDSCEGAHRLADGADLLLAEASFQEGREDVRGIHLTGMRAGLLAAGLAEDDGAAPRVVGRAVGRLVLTHLPPWTDPDVVRAEASQVFGGPIDLATPGAVWEL